MFGFIFSPCCTKYMFLKDLLNPYYYVLSHKDLLN